MTGPASSDPVTLVATAERPAERPARHRLRWTWVPRSAVPVVLAWAGALAVGALARRRRCW